MERRAVGKHVQCGAAGRVAHTRVGIGGEQRDDALGVGMGACLEQRCRASHRRAFERRPLPQQRLDERDMSAGRCRVQRGAALLVSGVERQLVQRQQHAIQLTGARELQHVSPPQQLQVRRWHAQQVVGQRPRIVGQEPCVVPTHVAQA